VGRAISAFEGLELYDGKLSRAVLRGQRAARLLATRSALRVAKWRERNLSLNQLQFIVMNKGFTREKRALLKNRHQIKNNFDAKQKDVIFQNALWKILKEKNLIKLNTL